MYLCNMFIHTFLMCLVISKMGGILALNWTFLKIFLFFYDFIIRIIFLPVLNQPIGLSILSSITNSEDTMIQFRAAAFGLIVDT